MAKAINIALQGGGSHGAFAWGVLDRILEDDRLIIEGISATSAGSMNGVICAYGLHKKGPDQARQDLRNFWQRISTLGTLYDPKHLFPWEHLITNLDLAYSLGFLWLEAITSLLSPYQFNPFNYNPLRDVLLDSINFDDLRTSSKIKLFLSATNVRSGMVKVFSLPEISIDVVLASACLPYLFQTIEIDGEPYWDGGYMGNPVLFPLIYETDSKDIMIVHINPMERHRGLTSATEIHNRVIEITFNASLIKELRAIDFIQKLLHQGWLKKQYHKHFKDVLIHSIRDEKTMRDLSASSKFNTSLDFLLSLYQKGRKVTDKWLDQHYQHLGTRSTVNLHQEFLKTGDIIG